MPRRAETQLEKVGVAAPAHATVPSRRHSLFLTSREIRASFSDFAIIAARQSATGLQISPYADLTGDAQTYSSSTNYESPFGLGPAGGGAAASTCVGLTPPLLSTEPREEAGNLTHWIIGKAAQGLHSDSPVAVGANLLSFAMYIQ